jgi:L-rhamnose-H+ transport protein
MARIFFVALIFLPWILAFLKVPHLLAAYSSVNTGSFVTPFLYGAGWGVAQVLFGLAVTRVGMALAFAVTIGLSAAFGTLVPVLSKNPRILATQHGDILLLGLLLMASGVLCCSWAGRKRENEKREGSAQSEHNSYTVGILMATAAGFLAPMLNYSLAFGDIFILQAIKHHASVSNAPYAVWPVALAGGAIPNLIYALFLAQTRRSWSYFAPAWPDWLLASIMGSLWMGSMAIYGTATTFLGPLGASIGWSIFQICIIVTANVSGWLAGEWNGISQRARVALWSGLLLLGCATLSISFGSH